MAGISPVQLPLPVFLDGVDPVYWDYLRLVQFSLTVQKYAGFQYFPFHISITDTNVSQRLFVFICPHDTV